MEIDLKSYVKDKFLPSKIRKKTRIDYLFMFYF